MQTKFPICSICHVKKRYVLQTNPMVNIMKHEELYCEMHCQNIENRSVLKL